MTVPLITLNDNTTIPQLGLGVWQVPPAETERVVSEALEIGYRHIDTAQMYGKRSLQESLERLGLEKVDLFLIHWPLPTQYDGDFVQTWSALVELRDAGLTTSIGVSNFQPDHLDRIVDATGVAPAVNQIEIHPYFTNEAARAASLKHGAQVEAWSPLGQGGGELEDPVILDIAQKHGKTPAQIALRWQLDRGDIVFPKSTHRPRLEENFDILDFALTDDQVEALAALDKGESGRTGPNPDTFDWIPA